MKVSVLYGALSLFGLDMITLFGASGEHLSALSFRGLCGELSWKTHFSASHGEFCVVDNDGELCLVICCKQLCGVHCYRKHSIRHY